MFHNAATATRARYPDIKVNPLLIDNFVHKIPQFDNPRPTLLKIWARPPNNPWLDTLGGLRFTSKDDSCARMLLTQPPRTSVLLDGDILKMNDEEAPVKGYSKGTHNAEDITMQDVLDGMTGFEKVAEVSENVKLFWEVSYC